MEPADKGKLTAHEKEKLGRSTWYLLHTIAKYYPSIPTPKEQKALRDFISGLSVVYPCPPCASAIDAFSRSSLFRTDSKAAVALSFCEFHNWVNAKLQKPLHVCSSQESSRLLANFGRLKAAVAVNAASIIEKVKKCGSCAAAAVKKRSWKAAACSKR